MHAEVYTWHWSTGACYITDVSLLTDNTNCVQWKVPISNMSCASPQSEEWGRIAAVEQQAFVALLKAMPNLTQLFAYIIVHTSRRMSKMLVYLSQFWPTPCSKGSSATTHSSRWTVCWCNVSSSCLERLALGLSGNRILTDFLRDREETSSILMGYLEGGSIKIQNITTVAQKFPNLQHLDLDSLSYPRWWNWCRPISRLRSLQTLRLMNIEFWHLTPLVNLLRHTH